MNIEQSLQAAIAQGLMDCFGLQAAAEEMVLQATKKEFEGAYTFVTFGYSKQLRQRPDAVAEQLGAYLKTNSALVADYNVVNGFLNLVISPEAWVNTLYALLPQPRIGVVPAKGQRVMVEFSSPNTNKPLHLGHLRNNFLGDSIARILAADGYEVVKANLVNDRGIHICKSMLAYQRLAQGETPQSAGLKGDKLVGKYYVKFEQSLREALKPILEDIAEGRNTGLFNAQEWEQLQTHQQKLNDLDQAYQRDVAALPADLATQLGIEDAPEGYKNLVRAAEQLSLNAEQKELLKQLKKVVSIEQKIAEVKGAIKEIAQNKTEWMQAAQAMLRQWEEGHPETVALWKQMNGWVYEGFAQTYQTIGISFDKVYYESDTYLLGKDIVAEGLEKGVFFRKDDQSVWIDLSADKLDEKLVLRGDGTSVYITQDMGTAELKYQDYGVDKSVYVVGSEQEYHFTVLFKILEKLGRPYAQGLYHLSYGMVDLPSGKMKSREGTVVDADDLVQEMVNTAAERTAELGKVADFSPEALQKLYLQLALGALKYFLLRVDPKKRILFNPQESIDFQGNTGPFIQYTYARISALLRKATQDQTDYQAPVSVVISDTEQALIQLLSAFPAKISESAAAYAPSLIANYAYEVAKTYNHFYHESPIFKAESAELMRFRLALTALSGRVIYEAMTLLGIGVPEQM
ncbi:arginine--tRNA ligase [Eisenibacter elegans]|uniref:arginine--tRNA ligase n=1 Tax=Eisenibacter elegans TaxID=997 RepID=UPI000411C2B4|nr:arginine--tRNA ligase [Eisenibacter elegans]